MPEPRTLLLVGVGVICLVLSQRWRRQLRRQL
ncbi:MAG: PEP-CTERM sorting domain-containing protein [Planctomycetes bacterium]|nr:PEP-CTERM sorting domain-containing protein [Planctomycetota bacterium]